MNSLWLCLLLGALHCIYADDQGTECVNGNTWMEDCNECFCSLGRKACRQNACPPAQEPECVDGDTWKEGCNDCSCSNGRKTCSTKTCPPIQGTECVTGTVWKEDCNDCFCSNGRKACRNNTCPPEQGNRKPVCDPSKCTWNVWSHYDAKGCKPMYTNGSCCPTHFDCPRPEDQNPDKCYLFGKEFSRGDKVPLQPNDTCDSGCVCRAGWPGEGTQIRCLQDVGLCWNYIPPSPGCYHVHGPCGGCGIEVCDKSPIHICKWKNGKYKEGQHMYFTGQEEFACQKCVCTKNFTTPIGEGCKRIHCGHTGINVDSKCVKVYHQASCCPFRSLCDEDPEISAIPNTSRASIGLSCTMGKFVRSVGERLEHDDCRMNCTCLTPPEFTCVKHRTCLEKVHESIQCPYSSACGSGGECRQDCGDLVEVLGLCSASANGCKCCKHERCASDTGLCRMRCLDDEYEDTWTGFGCGFANNFKDPVPKCCVKNSLATSSTTEHGPLGPEHPPIFGKP